MQIGQVIARIFDIDSKELKVVLSSLSGYVPNDFLLHTAARPRFNGKRLERY